MFAGVYREMRKVGVKNPRDVDEMEIWEIADALGVGREAEESVGQRDSRAHLRARVQAEQEGRPQPTFNDGIDEPPDDGYALMSILSSGSSLS